MTMRQNRPETTFVWPVALALAAVLGTLATACMMPFVAVATIAAATMDRPRALVSVSGVWAINQLLGFGLLGYPLTTYAVTWGLALGAVSIAAMLVARRVMGGRRLTVAMLGGAFVVSFAAYEGLLLLFSLAAGGTGTFTPAIVLMILANDAVWLVGMAALHATLTRLAPGLFGSPAALRLA
jgi:hypothetical protein